MDLKRRIQRRVCWEYRKFKWKMRWSSFEEMWDASSRILFYSAVREYFEFNDRIPEIYLDVLAMESCPVEAMWEMYLKEVHLQYQTWEEIEEILETMLMKWRISIAG